MAVFTDIQRALHHEEPDPPYFSLLPKIREHTLSLHDHSDAKLLQSSDQLKESIQTEKTISNAHIIQGFALVCEAARRTLNLSPFDVQIKGALALHHETLAEMQTGEGKTLVAVLPAYLNALTGKGVHILTFNDYLARRDAEWMSPIYTLLGLTVASVTQNMTPPQRKQAYNADITYTTAREAGFDYLRDRLCHTPNALVHRPFHYAIIDEADSILIDEARVPLVIAGSTDENDISPIHIAKVVADLKENTDFETDEYKRNVYFTESGIDNIESILSCGDLHSEDNLHLLTDLNCALHARVLIHRDIDYIIRDQKIEIVDEFTGRIAQHRRWPDGLQAALEAKEGLTLQARGTILGSITLQHFIQTYPKRAGMTATAKSAAEELSDCYALSVVTIPPNKPCIRIDHPDIVFTHKDAKHKALIDEITTIHKTKRPILVGTSNVEESDHLASILQQSGITCNILNAKNDADEAAIIAHAGELSAVTISTNMAGRGTDIQLGGPKCINRDKIIALGGLYVIGTNKHESLRIDNQLRGRAGRQGDPGSSRFFVSLEDYLIKRYGIDTLIPPKHHPDKQSTPIENPVIHREIARAQRIVEGQNVDMRKALYQYANILEKQRQIVQTWRQDILLDKEQPANSAPKRIALAIIDKHWREHLAQLAQIRDGIHIVSFGGQNPLEEFQKSANKIFQHCLDNIDEDIEKVNTTTVNGDRLKIPQSTWTYLVHDKTLAQKLESLLVGNRNIGFAAGGSLLLGPILLAMGIYRRLFKSRSGAD